jgi:hypothetical protein
MVFPEGYWLLHCEGYRVDTARGHEGYVEELLFVRRFFDYAV